MKKIFMTIFVTFVTISFCKGQGDAAIQAAFAESYKSEVTGNYVMSVSNIRSVYQADNYNMNARLGWLLFLARQYTESVNYYEKAIKLKPYVLEARFGLIKALNALESWDKVKEQYESILKIDGQNTTALYWLGVLLYNRKDYDSASRNFEKIVNLYPMDYGSVIMLAWTRYYQGRRADAKILFNQALLLSPEDPSAKSGLNLLK
ncbi:MAG TPA: tetratricopeptide repeat protein [Bacteroidales bacterium]|nr:tetratricopeptide repeat protein [Bacteroidales bacterium]